MSILLWAILAYLLYQFIFKLVIPVYTTSRKIKKGFQEMQDRMKSQGGQQPQQPRPKQSNPGLKIGEYIDFEEVK